MSFAIRQILVNNLLFLYTSLWLFPSTIIVANASANNNDLISSQYLEVYQQENKAEVEHYLRLTPLIKAAKDRNAKAIQVFIDSGVDPNAQMLGGATALHIAAANNDIETIKILLLNNVDVNRQDDELWTPLMRAAINGHIDAIRMLLVIKQINLAAANRFGETAILHAAVANCSACEIEILKAIDDHKQQNAFNDLGGQLKKSIQIAQKRKNNDLINVLETYYAQDYRSANYNFTSEDNELIDVRDVESIGKRLEFVASATENTTDKEIAESKTTDTSSSPNDNQQADDNKKSTINRNTGADKPPQVLQVNSNYGIRYHFMGKRVKEYELIANKNESDINYLLANKVSTTQDSQNNQIVKRYTERNNQSIARQKFIFSGKTTTSRQLQTSQSSFSSQNDNNNTTQQPNSQIKVTESRRDDRKSVNQPAQKTSSETNATKTKFKLNNKNNDDNKTQIKQQQNRQSVNQPAQKTSSETKATKSKFKLNNKNDADNKTKIKQQQNRTNFHLRNPNINNSSTKYNESTTSKFIFPERSSSK